MALGRVKTKLERSGEMVAYSEAALRNNAAIVEYCRTSMAAISGGTAGLLGFTGFFGFGFYVFAVLGLWLDEYGAGHRKLLNKCNKRDCRVALLMVKAGSQWKKYFINRRTILTNGFFAGLFTYILFWTFIYGMVHVY